MSHGVVDFSLRPCGRFCLQTFGLWNQWSSSGFCDRWLFWNASTHGARWATRRAEHAEHDIRQSHVDFFVFFQVFSRCVFYKFLEQRTLFESARECGSVASNLEIHGIFLQLCAHQLRRKASGDPGGLDCSSVVCRWRRRDGGAKLSEDVCIQQWGHGTGDWSLDGRTSTGFQSLGGKDLQPILDARGMWIVGHQHDHQIQRHRFQQVQTCDDGCIEIFASEDMEY